MVVPLGAGKPAMKSLEPSEPTHFEYELQEHREETSARLDKMQFIRVREDGTPPPRSSPPPRPPDPVELRRTTFCIEKEETDAWCRNLRKNTATFLAEMEAFRAEMRNEFRQLRLISNTNLHLLDCLCQTQSLLVSTPPIQPPRIQSTLVTTPLTHSPKTQSPQLTVKPYPILKGPSRSIPATGGVKKLHSCRLGAVTGCKTSKYQKQKPQFQCFISAAFGQVSDTDTNFSFMIGCSDIDSMFDAKLSGIENLESGNDSKSGCFGIMQDNIGLNSGEYRRERCALHLFDKSPKSNRLCFASCGKGSTPSQGSSKGKTLPIGLIQALSFKKKSTLQNGRKFGKPENIICGVTAAVPSSGVVAHGSEGSRLCGSKSGKEIVHNHQAALGKIINFKRGASGRSAAQMVQQCPKESEEVTVTTLVPYPSGVRESDQGIEKLCSSTTVSPSGLVDCDIDVKDSENEDSDAVPMYVKHTEAMLDEIDRMKEVEELEDSIMEFDSSCVTDPLSVVEYIDDNYALYRKTENQSCVSPSYMAQQQDINENLRAILIDWFIEVDKFEVTDETLFLTINLIDRSLEHQVVDRKKLQLVGVTAMLLACKYEEVSVPIMEDFVLISDKAYTRQDVLDMENSMVNKLQFNFSVPTPYLFMRRFLKAAESDKKIELLSFLIALCLVEYEMLKYPLSLLAAASNDECLYYDSVSVIICVIGSRYHNYCSNASMDKIEVSDFHQTVEVEGIRFWCYTAGHVLGASMFMADIAGVQVLYTGDYSREEDRHLRAAETPQFSPDICIIESTFGVQYHQPRNVREKRFTEAIHTAISRGGRVLIPAFALGRARELLLILDEYWSNHPEFHNIPIYYAFPLIKKCLSVYEMYTLSMNDRIRNAKSNPFIFKHISPLKSIDNFKDVSPSVVMASPGTLQSGLSRQLFDLWCSDKRNACVIPGYVIEGTLVKIVMNEPKEVTLMNGLAAPLNMSIHYISVAVHADSVQTSAFLEELRPPNIILVHGEWADSGKLHSWEGRVNHKEKMQVQVILALDNPIMKALSPIAIGFTVWGIWYVMRGVEENLIEDTSALCNDAEGLSLIKAQIFIGDAFVTGELVCDNDYCLISIEACVCHLGEDLKLTNLYSHMIQSMCWLQTLHSTATVEETKALFTSISNHRNSSIVHLVMMFLICKLSNWEGSHGYFVGLSIAAFKTHFFLVFTTWQEVIVAVCTVSLIEIEEKLQCVVLIQNVKLEDKFLVEEDGM